MMFDHFRRRLALVIAPELANLPHRELVTSRRAKSLQMALCAQELRVLDQLYAAYTGVTLLERNAPLYAGQMYLWKRDRKMISLDVVMTLKRLRKDPVCGVHMTTNFVARNYFASIWPKGLAWPADIKNPISEEGAA